MSYYTGRTPSGENLLRTLNFDYPAWTPVHVSFLPAARTKYFGVLDDIMLSYPRLFPNHQKSEIPGPAAYEGLYALGRLKDCWGCVWENVHPGNIGQVVVHPLEDWANFDSWKRPDPYKDDLLGPRDWDAISESIQSKKRSGDFDRDHVLPHGHHYLLMCDLRGFENAMIDMITDEPMLYKLMDVIIDYNYKVTERTLDLGTEFYGMGEDLGTQKALPISPEIWRRFVKPGYEATAGQGRDRGVPVYLHCDGHILPIIDDLIETGVRMINPQVRPNTLEGLREKMSGKVAINLDLDRQLFPFATPSEVAKHVRDCHEALWMPEGGLGFNVEINDDVPIENLHALFGALEEVCRLPEF